MRQSTSLALMWEILSTSETISTYTISFTNTNNTQCFKNSSVISEITGLHFTLRNLQEATEYNITVSAILSDGSTRNDYLIATTLAAGWQSAMEFYYNCMIFSLGINVSRPSCVQVWL